MTIIRTKQFILRPLQLSDTKGYFEVMQDQETKMNLNSVPADIKEARLEIKKYILQAKEKGSENFTIEIRKKYAGNVLLQPQNWDAKTTDGRVHLWIHPYFRGKGIATKALEATISHGFEKRYDRIFAQHKAINKGLLKIMEKLGFRKVKVHMIDGAKKILWVKEKKR